MKTPAHKLLLQAAARLNADGHTDLAAEVLALARQWTPEGERELVGGIHPINNQAPLHDA